MRNNKVQTVVLLELGVGRVPHPNLENGKEWGVQEGEKGREEDGLGAGGRKGEGKNMESRGGGEGEGGCPRVRGVTGFQERELMRGNFSLLFVVAWN